MNIDLYVFETDEKFCILSFVCTHCLLLFAGCNTTNNHCIVSIIRAEKYVVEDK